MLIPSSTIMSHRVAHGLFYAALAVLWGGCNEVVAQEKHLDFPVLALGDGRAPEEFLALGGHNLALLSRQDLNLKLELNFGNVRIAAASVIGSRVLVAGSIDAEAGYLAMHSLDTGEVLWKLSNLDAPLTSICIAGQRCCAGNELGQVAAYDLQTGTKQWTESFHSKLVTSIVCIDDELCASGDWVGKIVVFEGSSGMERSNFQQHRSRISSLLVDASTTPVSLVSASRDGTVRLWYPTQRRLVRFVQLGGPVTAIQLAGDGQVLAATNDATLHRVDLRNAKVLSSTPSNRQYLTALLARDQDSLLASEGRAAIFSLQLASVVE